MQKMLRPPAPADLYDFPEDTQDEILYEKDLKPVSRRVHRETGLFALPFPVLSLADPTIERVQTAKLTVKRRWQRFFQATIDVGEEFTHAIEYCHGVTSSKGQTTEFGTDIGAKGDLASINAKLKQITQSTYTVTQNKKETYQIVKSVKKPTTVCWWQEVRTFETSGAISEYVCIKILGTKNKKRVKIGSRPYTHTISVEEPKIAVTSYPK